MKRSFIFGGEARGGTMRLRIVLLRSSLLEAWWLMVPAWLGCTTLPRLSGEFCPSLTVLIGKRDPPGIFDELVRPVVLCTIVAELIVELPEIFDGLMRPVLGATMEEPITELPKIFDGLIRPVLGAAIAEPMTELPKVDADNIGFRAAIFGGPVGVLLLGGGGPLNVPARLCTPLALPTLFGASRCGGSAFGVLLLAGGGAFV